MSDVSIRKEFARVQLNAKGENHARDVETLFSMFLTELEKNRSMKGRPFALVVTKLQEAKMWATRAIAEDPDCVMTEVP